MLPCRACTASVVETLAQSPQSHDSWTCFSFCKTFSDRLSRIQPPPTACISPSMIGISFLAASTSFRRRFLLFLETSSERSLTAPPQWKGHMIGRPDTREGLCLSSCRVLFFFDVILLCFFSPPLPLWICRHCVLPTMWALCWTVMLCEAQCRTILFPRFCCDPIVS